MRQPAGIKGVFVMEVPEAVVDSVHGGEPNKSRQIEP